MEHQFFTQLIEEEMVPGVVVHAGRQAGKTEALMKLVHHRCHGDAIVIAINRNQADQFAYRYRNTYPADQRPHLYSSEFVNEMILRGHNDPVFCDDFWDFKAKARTILRDNWHRISGAVGTVPRVHAFPLCDVSVYRPGKRVSIEALMLPPDSPESRYHNICVTEAFERGLASKI